MKSSSSSSLGVMLTLGVVMSIFSSSLVSGQTTTRPTPQPSPFPACTACSEAQFQDQQSCSQQFGCLWNPQLNICGNECLYETETRCNECSQDCRWVAGAISVCIVKWDFLFDVCFVVDDSQSITRTEWEAIRRFFIVGVIEALTPTSCDLNNPSTIDKCPAVGVVQFNFDSFVVIPANLSLLSAQYRTIRASDNSERGQFSVCFANDTILKPLEVGWQNTILAMQLGIDRSGQDGGGTFTLRGVTRCVDLLMNTARTRRRALSLLVTQTDGNPNGPLECFGSACPVCGIDKYHDGLFTTGTFTFDEYPECDTPFIDALQRSRINRANSVKIQEWQIRNVLVLYKFGVDAVVTVTNVNCLVGLVAPFNTIFLISELALNSFAFDPAARQELVNNVANISNILCQFQTNPPTMSPTLPPTDSPSNSPTRSPTQSPSESPTQSPTRAPTRSPTNSPTRSPTAQTGSPSVPPTKAPTICTGPPPDYTRANCANTCDGTNAIISVDPSPAVTTDLTASTTTMCWDYTLVDPASGPCGGVSSAEVVGVSFVLDECCPDGSMDFVDAVDLLTDDAGVFPRAICPVDEANPFASGCRKDRRDCSSRTNENQKCTVINLNGLSGASETSGKYCLTMAGTNFDTNNDGRIDDDKRDTSKICFERNTPGGGATSFCSCVEIDYVRSRDVCQKTSNPSPAPTQPPVPDSCPPPECPPLDKCCKKDCGDIDQTEWEVNLETYTPGDEYTEFEYCVSVNTESEPLCKAYYDNGYGLGKKGGKSSSGGGNGGNDGGSSSSGGGDKCRPDRRPPRGNGGNGKSSSGGSNGGQNGGEKGSSNGGGGNNGGKRGGNRGGRRGGNGNAGRNGGSWKPSGGKSSSRRLGTKGSYGNGGQNGGNGGNGKGGQSSSGGNGGLSGFFKKYVKKGGDSGSGGNGGGNGKKGGNGGSSSSGGNGGNGGPSPFTNPDFLTLRLDECCPLCLTKKYHIGYSSGSLKIKNPFYDYPPDGSGSAYMRLGPEYRYSKGKSSSGGGNGYGKSYSYGKECYRFKVKGRVGLEDGTFNVRGGKKCACGTIKVPSSCDLKAIADPSCEKTTKRPTWKRGKSSSSNGGNGGNNGGKSSSGGNGKGGNGGQNGGKSSSNGGGNGGKGQGKGSNGGNGGYGGNGGNGGNGGGSRGGNGGSSSNGNNGGNGWRR